MIHFKAAKKVSMENSIVLLVFTLSLITVGNVEARIWFVGDQMPGLNRTITEEPIVTPSWAPPQFDKLEKIIGRGITKMALAMESVVGTEVDNLIFAPLSIASALSVVLLGAAGRTSAEIASFLGLLAGVDFTDRTQIVHSQLGRYFTKFEKNPGVELGTQLAFASGIFVQEGFSIKPQFDKLAREVYKCEVIPLDFMNHPEEARQVVNKWVASRTNERIKEILPHALSPMTSVIIANALYFNGQWEYPFSGKTKMGSFHVNDKEIIEMPLMVSGADLPYFQSPSYTIFGMPYKGGDLTMYIVLPQSNLHKFVSELSVDSIEEMINQTTVQTILYVVPRMKLESTLNLRKPLEDLGIRTLFDSTVSDLSGIGNGVYASDVLHKVEIQVTETGTIAAAGTATALIRGGMPLVRVVRPFLFFIYHNPTSTITFWGSVYKPSPYHGK